MTTLPYMRVLIPAIAVAVILALGAYIHLTIKEARYIFSGPTTISVQGIGEAVAVPDIGTFSFSVMAERKDVAAAQEQSAQAINEIVNYLKEQGVEEKDIKTSAYNLNPQYDYTARICPANTYCPPGDPVLRGYQISQMITVKVRNTEQSGELIAGVGQRGATNISGLSFTIDDEEVIKAEARANAIEDAKEKAAMLADDLGVDIVRMTGFWEDQGYYPMPGYGGDARMESASYDMAVAPQMPTGENEFTVQVNISYEVR